MLWAVEADEYVDGHLVREPDGSFRCPASGRIWLQDFPEDEQGVATVRVRWLELTAADVVGYLATDPGVDDYLRTMDPAVSHQPLPEERVLNGVGELREYTAAYLRDPSPPRSGAISVICKGDDAVVLGHVSHNRGGRYVEHRPAAWIVSIRDGRVTHVRAFSDWARAKAAAGVRGEERPLRRLGSGFMRFLRGCTGRPGRPSAAVAAPRC